MTTGERILHQPLLTARMRELCILAVTAAHPAPFVAYAHRRIGAALDPAPLTTETTAQACRGTLGDTTPLPPADLTDDEVVVYRAALRMAKNVGEMTDKDFEEVEVRVGKEGVARIAHVVGWYLGVCLLCRLGKVEVPEEEQQGRGREE